MATRRIGPKKKKAPFKGARRIDERCLEEQEILVSSDEPNELQIKEAEEIIERLRRKYRHKIEEIKQGHLIDDFVTLSPSKKKENARDDTCHVLKDKENLIDGSSSKIKLGHNQEKTCIVNKERNPIANTKPLKDQMSISRQSSIEPNSHQSSIEPSIQLSIEPSSLTTPENQSTPFIISEKRQQERKKHYSHFGFSKLNSSEVYSTLPPTPPTMDSFAFPSPSHSPTPPIVNKKAVKALTFDGVSSFRTSVCANHGVKKGCKKRPVRKPKKEKSQDIDEWAECINKEFEEIDDYQLVID